MSSTNASADRLIMAFVTTPVWPNAAPNAKPGKIYLKRRTTYQHFEVCQASKGLEKMVGEGRFIYLKLKLGEQKRCRNRVTRICNSKRVKSGHTDLKMRPKEGVNFTLKSH